MEVKTKADEIARDAFANHWDLIKTPALLEEAKRLLGIPKIYELMPSSDNWERIFGEVMRRRTQHALDLAARKAKRKAEKAIETLLEMGYGIIPPSQ